MNTKVKLRKRKRRHVCRRCNLEKLKDKGMQDKFTAELSKKLKENNNKHEWDKLKACLTTAAAEIRGIRKMTKKQYRMTEDILELMEEAQF